MRVVVLLSGGLDSAVALAVHKDDGDECLPIAFDYGQRHRAELACAWHIAAYYGLELKICKVEFPSKTSDLLHTRRGTLARWRDEAEICGEIGTTYVECRNAVFLSLAASYAESVGADAIVTGFNSQDARGYPAPDSRPEFATAFERMLDVGTRRGVQGRPIRIFTPLAALSKGETVEWGCLLGAPMHLSRSCFETGRRPCGACDACVIRRNGFADAGVVDIPMLWRVAR